jgi:hypothetical protein
MNKRIGKLAVEAGAIWDYGDWGMPPSVYFAERDLQKFAELIYRDVIASILITDIVMEEKGQTPTSEDYIRAINKDFGVEE